MKRAFAGLLGLLVAAARAANLVIDPGHELWTISSAVVGTHHVYCNDRDAIYAHSDLIPWMHQAGIGTSRYPGGSVVKYWDWEHPTGVLGGDPWNPKWNPARNSPPANWMSLDEYLDLVRRTGIRPCFGVNTISGIEFHRQSDSIARAARMVAYVKERGFGGAIWYLGNEEIGWYPPGDKVAEYAENFARHARAMKAVDPGMLTFWNDNDAKPERVRDFLAHDRGMADGLESHGKWPFGGMPGLAPCTVDQWLAENPLYDHKNSHVWRRFADQMRAAARAAGRPGLLIANLEYGLGSHGNISGFDRYTKGLLMTDMLQEHVIGNWFATAFWSNVRDNDEDGLVAYEHGDRLNPFHFGMELIAAAQGGRMLEARSDDSRLYGFAVRKGTTIYLYAINKHRDRQRADFTLAGIMPVRPEARLLHNSADGFGQLDAWPVQQTPRGVSAGLPGLSYIRIALSAQ